MSDRRKYHTVRAAGEPVRCVVQMADSETGEIEATRDLGLMVSGAELIEDSLARMRSLRDLSGVFAFILKLDLSPEACAALWDIARRSDTWKAGRERSDDLGRYLRAAVGREADRQRLERWRDTRSAEQVARELEAATELNRRQSRPARPDRALASKQARAARREHLGALARRARLTPDQRRLLVTMVAERLTPTEAMELLGLPEHTWQGLVRKLRRAAA